MKLLLALNHKFMEKDVYQLIKFIEENDTAKVVDGYEIMVDCLDESHMDYLENLATLSKEKGFILQVHSSSYDSIDIQKVFLDKLEEIALFLDRNIHVVYHPVSDNDSCDLALVKTNELIGELLIYCYQKEYHLTLSLENLEHRSTGIRLDKDDIKPVLYNNIDLKYTYDLGHEFKDYGQVTDVDALMLKRLSNVHLFRNELDVTHIALKDSDSDKSDWVKGLLYLKQSGYDKSVVLEYDFYLIEGDTFELKVLSYLKHAKFIKDYL